MEKKSRQPLAWLLAVTFVLAGRAFAEEPGNLAFFKQQLIRYHDSGEYAYDIEQVARQALSYLNQRVAEKPNNRQNKLALVFDIDETSLSNYHHLFTFNFGGRPQEMKEALVQANDPAIPATLQLYRQAKEHGVAVFFVTGRTEDLRDATEQNLRRAGYTDWEGIFFKPLDYRQSSVVPYKSGAREQIEKEGYTIVLNIGDQYSDLAGGYAERAFKLPNPYYYIP